jgi:hypothetical protein
VLTKKQSPFVAQYYFFIYSLLAIFRELHAAMFQLRDSWIVIEIQFVFSVKFKYSIKVYFVSKHLRVRFFLFM